MSEAVFKSGFVSIIGRPNVGKSTLLNTIIGEKITIVSDKPQTTRNKILGVKNFPGVQIIFMDTPGIHKPRHKLNEYMVKAALSTFDEVDIILFMVGAGESAGSGDRHIVELLTGVRKPVFLLINKIDSLPKNMVLPQIEEYRHVYPFKEIFPISALCGDNIDRLLDAIIQELPEGPQYFPEDIATDQPMRFIASEIIREKIFQLTFQEVPYSIAVGIEDFKEVEDRNLAVIRGVIFVERDSQKGIIIGKGGAMLKKVGQLAREEIEAIMGIKVFLELWVKVKEKWQSDDQVLKMLGYKA